MDSTVYGCLCVSVWSKSKTKELVECLAVTVYDLPIQTHTHMQVITISVTTHSSSSTTLSLTFSASLSSDNNIFVVSFFSSSHRHRVSVLRLFYWWWLPLLERSEEFALIFQFCFVSSSAADRKMKSILIFKFLILLLVQLSLVNSAIDGRDGLFRERAKKYCRKLIFWFDFIVNRMEIIIGNWCYACENHCTNASIPPPQKTVCINEREEREKSPRETGFSSSSSSQFSVAIKSNKNEINCCRFNWIVINI